MNYKKIRQIAFRLCAVFVSAALSIVGLSSVAEQLIKSAPALPLWYSALLAGGIAVVEVGRKLADFAKDGALSQEEIDAAFDSKIIHDKAVKAAKKVHKVAVATAEKSVSTADTALDTATAVADKALDSEKAK